MESWCIEYHYAYWASISSLLLYCKGLLSKEWRRANGLKPSQFSRLYDPERYEYTENGSKNRTGGFYRLGIDNKSVPIFRNVHAGECCLVSLLDLRIFE